MTLEIIWPTQAAHSAASQCERPPKVCRVTEERFPTTKSCSVAEADKDGPLFRSAQGKTKQLALKPMSRIYAWKMEQRRLGDAGIGGGQGFRCHSFRATCRTNFISNGGGVETYQMLKVQANSRTTKHYDRRARQPTLADIEHIRYEK